MLSFTSVAPKLASRFEERLLRALNDMRLGRPVILVDDFDRENEADLIAAAETISVPTMALFIREGSGIVCLCLTEETSMGFVQWSNSPEQRIQFSESEVYLDQHALTLLDNLGISSRGDLHDLRDRSVGVYHLYRAAKKFCIKKRAKSFDSALVEEWINAEFGELYGKTIARHSAKLINPKYKKGAGKKGAKKHFSRGALARLNLDKDYAPERLEPFVSEPLAFLLAAADWWTRELKKLSNRERDTLSRGHLMNTLIGLGFEGEEEIDSLMSIVMWPEKSSPKKT